MMGKGRQVLVLFVVILSASVGDTEAHANSMLLKCGSSASSVNVSGRRWVGDLVLDNNVSLSSGSVAVTTSVENGGPLYDTARVFTNVMNYTFEGIQGSCFLRLHFCPFFSEDYNVNKSSFSIMANGLKLVSEFNVPGEISRRSSHLQSSANSSSFLIKEFILDVKSSILVIEFIPSEGSFGFINAIEILPVVGNLALDSASKVGSSETNLNVSGRGIEMMYRLNVGGERIEPSMDSDLWRTWEVDSGYMVTRNAGIEMKNISNITYASSNDSSVAPLALYETARAMSNNEVLGKRFNMSWKFEVDPGFDYLIRLHFCELLYDKANERIFRIYINNKTAAENFDIYEHAGGRSKAYHLDFVDAVSSETSTLWIQLGPETAVGGAGTDALLNGLEIFKLSKIKSLAYTEKSRKSGNSGGSSASMILWVGIGAGVAFILCLGVISAFIFFFCKPRSKDRVLDAKTSTPGWQPLFLLGAAAQAKGVQNLNASVSSSRVGKRFTLAEIRLATNNFDENLVIGVGGFGKVYKGEIEDSIAAIKRSNPLSQQGLAEFETEIEMLSKLRHRHLVSLIGFCEEQDEMILVYEYMANGTLRSHLFGSDLPPMTWKQRLEACIGAARGLHYLHTGFDCGIIHRDVKTTNILLDEEFVAKMSDFGLSKTGPAWDHTHVSTAVKGSFGYLDPEYFRRQHLTEKSDVYSFGVVLFEVVCARAVINPSFPRDQINLAEWAMSWQRQRSLETITDPHLRGAYCPESMKKFGEIAEKCLADEGKNRPTMGEVLWHLEYVLQLQEAWFHANSTENSFTSRV